MRELVAALAAVPILALVYAEFAVRRLRLIGLLALPVLGYVYLAEMVRRPKFGVSALAVMLLPALAVAGAMATVPGVLDARSAGRPAIEELELQPLPSRAPVALGDSAAADAANQALAAPGADGPGPGGTRETDPTEEAGPAAPDGTVDGAAPANLARVTGPGYGEPPTGQPTVVRFRPQGSATEVDQGALLSVRFDRPMAHDATEAAFAATVDGRSVAGALSWAEGDTVLVLDPADPLPYGARVVLRVGTDARDVTGQPLERERAISFTVEPKPTPAPTPRPAFERPTGGTTAAQSRSSSVTANGWQWPVIGPITQYFGQSLTIYGTHYGIDIDGDTGDPIRAAAAGTVSVAGYYDKCGGLDVHIDHGDGLVSWYRHLSKVLVSEGDRVGRGDTIGRMGNTGCSFGSHLHFALRRGSTWIDPLTVLPRR